jgi:hypothetical protein
MPRPNIQKMGYNNAKNMYIEESVGFSILNPQFSVFVQLSGTIRFNQAIEILLPPWKQK